MKWIKRLLLLAIVVGVLVGIGMFYVDGFVRDKVVVISGETLGVPTSLDSISLGFLNSDCRIDGLTILNPEGFEAPHFLTLKKGYVSVNARSLLADKVEVPTLRFDGLDLRLELKAVGGANYEKILENIQRNLPASDSDQEGRRFVVDEVLLRNVRVYATALGAEVTRAEVGEIRLEKVGSETEGGILLSQLAGTIVQALMVEVRMNPDLIAILPQALMKNLDQGLSQFVDLGNLGKMVELPDLQSLGGGAVESLGKQAEGLLKSVLGK